MPKVRNHLIKKKNRHNPKFFGGKRGQKIFGALKKSSLKDINPKFFSHFSN